MRTCATAALGTYTDKAGQHLVHRLIFVEADSMKDAKQQAHADFASAFPQCELLSILVEPASQ